MSKGTCQHCNGEIVGPVFQWKGLRVCIACRSDLERESKKRGTSAPPAPITNEAPAVATATSSSPGLQQSRSPMVSVELETCANCGRTIGNLETPHLWNQQVVCGECINRLSSPAPAVPPPASSLVPRPASRPSTMGRFLRILGVVDGDTPMSCPHCGTDNPVTAQSCQSCGVPIRTAVQVKVPWRLTIISLLFCGVGCCGPVGCIGAFFCGNISIVALIFCIMANCAGDIATAQSKSATAKMFALAGITVGSLAFVGNLVFQILSWYAQMGRHYSG